MTLQIPGGWVLPYLGMLGEGSVVMTIVFEIKDPIGPYVMPHHNLIDPLFLQK